MIRTTTLVIALLLAPPLAARQARLGALGESNPAAEPVSIVALLANPEKYDGKALRVIGAFRLQLEANRICLHHEDLVHGLAKNCLWIGLDAARLGPGARERLVAHNGEYVVMEGKFSMKHRGHMNQFAGSLGGIWHVSEWSVPDARKR